MTTCPLAAVLDNMLLLLLLQWAATMTQSGSNLPFVSPLRADKLPNGFQISMLMKSNKTKSFGSAADLVATVEQQDGVVSDKPRNTFSSRASRGSTCCHSERLLFNCHSCSGKASGQLVVSRFT